MILRPSDSLGSDLALPHSICVTLEEFTHIVIQQTFSERLLLSRYFLSTGTMTGYKTNKVMFV